MQKIKINILLKAFKKILEIRETELNIATEFKKNKIFSFLHLCIGQEASAVGVSLGSNKNDIFFGNHRSHGHYLAKDGDLKKLIFEVFGDIRGSCNGYGGSMHMIDHSVNFFGSIPILGSSAPIASGISMAQKLNKSKNITIVFVGDGSAEEGSFYETINMAGLYKLPLMVVIEDNRYAVEADIKKRKVNKYNFKNIFQNGLQAHYLRANGNNFVDVYKSTILLRKKILKNKKVGILHLDCLRHAKHSGANIDIVDQKSPYRYKNEYKEIINSDPIKIIKNDIIRHKFNKIKLELLEKKIRNKYNMLFYKTFNTIKIRSL